MHDDLVPPPRRPAPDQLRRRIQQELDQAAQPAGRRPLRLIIPIAAAVALVAGVSGAVAAQVMPDHHDTLVVEPAQSPHPTKTSSPSYDSPTSHKKGERATRPLTDAEVVRDTKLCLASDKDNPWSKPHRGELRAVYAVSEPPISNDPNQPAHRRMFLVNKQGILSCIDGRSAGWSDRGQSDQAQTATNAAARQEPLYLDDWTRKCRSRSSSSVETEMLLRVDGDRVAESRITITSSDGKQLIKPAGVAIRGGWLYTGVKITGPEAWKKGSITLEVLDDNGNRLPIRPYKPGSAKTVDVMRMPIERCR